MCACACGISRNPWAALIGRVKSIVLAINIVISTIRGGSKIRVSIQHMTLLRLCIVVGYTRTNDQVIGFNL